MLKGKIEKLSNIKDTPSVSISMNTHRTHPDNAKDVILLKNLCKEAETRLISEYDKKQVLPLLKQLNDLPAKIDERYNLDSFHVFLSNEIQEVIKSIWPIQKNSVTVSSNFSIRPLIKILNRTEEYLILLLSQSGVNLYSATNDLIVEEVKNDDFPFSESPFFDTEGHRLSDANRVDNLIREFLNRVDKALNRVYADTKMKCVVVSTEDNYSKLLQVADNSKVYHGFTAINYNDTAKHTLVAKAWEIIKENQKKFRTEAINEILEAVGKGLVLTDIHDIYRAAKEGRGDLLITHFDFIQPAKALDNNSIELVADGTVKGVIDDVSSEIAWEVISKKGRAIFTQQNELKELGHIALKVRY